ncbi:hypothetical protein DDB_G0276567 [Dictyostelium discoideum AX4]|uniref:ALA-interacting subunit n=1 Tax=Dictyostelium discoideum TaxID=44689 RepID=Q551J1_DICDI|nr:hypothetical protein DDB_G0276567 [Dictyostelium discoideum AX4]EAL69237.1 hypothetical protein DDB_G0276567 [Dictyostelium discoideum AX4]|eukprot:XP_643143.1 hypothetical protein DDB_G0276567 [Dictyostelium discoideum AX4]
MAIDKDSSKRPANTAFKQQRLKAWEPILTPGPVIIAFIVIGIVFIPIGAAIINSSNKVLEHVIRYDDNPNCQLGQKCTINYTLPTEMESPVYLYYKLDNFYQNHRRYVKSRNDDQLRGIEVTDFSKLKDCEPLITTDGSEDVNKILVPCGLIANSVFNDSISLADASGNLINLTKKGIAWQSDIDKKFKNYPENGVGVINFSNFEDEDFIVWMRTAALPDFKKLYRIYHGQNGPLSGTIQIRIDNKYPVASFDGKKYVVLSTTSWIGGKNPFLGYAYIIVGIICFVQGVVFAIKHKISPRVLGSPKYLEWNK